MRMEKKLEKLPSNMSDIMKRGNIDELKQVYDTCDIHARFGTYECDIPFFMYTPCTEFYQWLVKQGLDIHMTNTQGETPLHTAVIRQDCEDYIESLVKAGADLEAKATFWENTPLHYAGRYKSVLAVKKLLELGAEVNARTKFGQTPLDELLNNAKFRDVIRVAECAEMLLTHDGICTVDANELIMKLGKNFELYKYEIAQEELAESIEAMKKIYQLFHVETVPEIRKHDGHSYIEILTDDDNALVEELWEYLVPVKGTCCNVQGEVIRISNNIFVWLFEGGNPRWVSLYNADLERLSSFLKLGTPLENGEQEEALSICKKITYKSDYALADRLCVLCAKWVRKNREPIPLMKHH